ncbi:LOW QUALITY PROTEIN: hypothetical protein HID58_014589 [Brassica napus]|uniref:Leucine-rich repeat-containing N-terminal plant-type domain-containing protein n=1 Tax=Brassica napus TaxID=3708 RepID=A0ABQ8DHP8_BRANA|nr:LOW QUALITY PROTEIN: hypothetical protein HID58_014589 [Brassica napus]
MHSCSERKMMTIWSLCLIFSLFNSLLIFASPAKQLCRSDQKNALLEFKSEFHFNAIAGNEKTQRWTNTTDCCSWDGISCDIKTGNVVELNLWGSSLNGSLRSNSSLFRLQHLQSLNLSSNNLAGILPDSIGNFKYLKVLKLYGCSFFGNIPSSLGNLSYLTHLDLDGNDFTGELPESLSNLNQLTNGPIPGSISKLVGLSYVDLSFWDTERGVVDFSIFLHLKSLTLLDISHLNSRSMLDLSLFSNFTSLTLLHLSGNNLHISSTLHLPSPIGSLGLSSCNISEFPKFLRTQTGLFFLNISANQFQGHVPEWLWRLPGLGFRIYKTIDVSGNRLEGDIPQSIGLLKELIMLNMSNNAFTGHIPPSLSNLTNLQSLDLSQNRLSGTIPPELEKLTFLAWMNFSNNMLEGPIPQGTQIQSQNSSSFAHNPGLCGAPLKRSCGEGEEEARKQDEEKEEKDQVLSWIAAAIAYAPGVFCGFVIGHILERKMITWRLCLVFSLSYSVLVFASPAKNLCRPDQRDALWDFKNEFIVQKDDRLSYSNPKTESWRNNTDCCSWDGVRCYLQTGNVVELNLWGSFLSGPLRSNSSLFRLQHLEILNLGSNPNLYGNIPSSLGNLSYLTDLVLSDCGFTATRFDGGPLDIGNVSSPSKLRNLGLGRNNFSGPMLGSTSKLVSLKDLDLSFWRDSLNFSIFLHLTSLERLDLSYPNTRIMISSTLHFPSPIYMLKLSSCNISHFPKFLQSKTSLSYLDISANQIEGQVPEWLWRLRYVDISQNSFSSFEGPSDVFQRSGRQPNSTMFFLGSGNLFTGEIPRMICELVNLQTLVLSNNNFSGFIPQCFKNFNTTISVLHLQNNSLSGAFPQESIGGRLRSLDVGHNRLSGKLPKSLVNCTQLEFLNVEDNRFNDTFPFWLRSLPILQFLVLRSNKFHGPVSFPQDSMNFSKLRIFDVSQNLFTGVLPSDYFAGWSAMSSPVVYVEAIVHMLVFQNYHKSVGLTNKGSNMDLVGSGFRIYKTIDVSGNRLEGDIPQSIGLLKELVVLNMSNNAFTGHIPPSLSNLTNLQSLDLSRNRLSGTIPPDLEKLTFLAWMNFSNNMLEGPIPQGTQIQSQNSSSFAQNPGLCGAPLKRSCGEGEEEARKQEKEDEEKEEKDQVLSWIAAAIGYGHGVFCGFVIGHILSSYRHDWLMRIFRSFA